MKSSNTKVQSSNKNQNSNSMNSVFDLEERMSKFGENMVLFCRAVEVDYVSRPLVHQLTRSATSIGANYSEANNASSRKDFRNKAIIAKKEAQETKYWLRMLKPCYPDLLEALDSFWKEAHELTLILQSIINKLDGTNVK